MKEIEQLAEKLEEKKRNNWMALGGTAAVLLILGLVLLKKPRDVDQYQGRSGSDGGCFD